MPALLEHSHHKTAPQSGLRGKQILRNAQQNETKIIVKYEHVQTILKSTSSN